MPYSRVWVINLFRSISSPEPALPSYNWTGNGSSGRIQNRNLKILVRFNCARVKLFTNLTKRSSWGNLALLAHCYNLIVSKQFFLSKRDLWSMYLILKKELERTVQEDRKKASRLKHSLVIGTHLSAKLYANLKGSVSCMNLRKSGIEMTFKNKANFWTKWHRSVVSCFMEIKFFS